ncbi:MAG TPA: sterol desaturase family protein [Polyangiaceae bacterium]|nr:sterol desaturase family protein [Polyangiaceae bacterium]
MSGTPWDGQWDDPLFRALAVGGQLVSMGAFVAFAAPLTLLAWRDPAWARRYRIQSRRPRAQQLVGPSIGRWLVNNALLGVVITVAWPWLRPGRVGLGPLPAPWVVVAELFAFAALDDFLYYWMHRALHTRWLFKKIHGVHHRIVTPWAITGHYMHPLEYVATGLLMLAGPALFGAHVFTAWLWIVLRQWEAAEGHSGYALPWSPSKLFPGSDGAVHHDAHHARVHGNFAGYFPHTDRWFGTLVRGYAELRLRRATTPEPEGEP